MDYKKLFKKRCFEIGHDDLPDTTESKLFKSGIENKFISYGIMDNGDILLQHGSRGDEGEGIYDLLIKKSDAVRTKAFLLYAFCFKVEQRPLQLKCIYNFYISEIIKIYDLDGRFFAFYQGEIKGTALVKAQESIKLPPKMEVKDVTNPIFECMRIGPSKGKNKVYLMIDERNGCTKIGKSIDPKYREGTLQSKVPEITLIASWVCSANVETMLHRLFSKKRLRGEWFSLDIKDYLKINSIMKNYHEQSPSNCTYLF